MFKVELDKYRNAAQRMISARRGRVTVEPHGRVMPLADGGAFVELMMFVPESELSEQEEQDGEKR